MTISQAVARMGLEARVTPAGTNVAGPARVGTPMSAQKKWTDADIAYAFKVTGGVLEVATLTLSTGVVAATGGSPTIVDGDGKDLEGATLPGMVTLYAVQFIPGSGNSVKVQVADSSSKLPDVDVSPGDVISWKSTNGITVGAGTLAFTFYSVGHSLEVVVIGKSS